LCSSGIHRYGLTLGINGGIKSYSWFPKICPQGLFPGLFPGLIPRAYSQGYSHGLFPGLIPRVILRAYSQGYSQGLFMRLFPELIPKAYFQGLGRDYTVTLQKKKKNFYQKNCNVTWLYRTLQNEKKTCKYPSQGREMWCFHTQT
jgi:hypothetical protein